MLYTWFCKVYEVTILAALFGCQVSTNKMPLWFVNQKSGKATLVMYTYSPICAILSHSPIVYPPNLSCSWRRQVGVNCFWLLLPIFSDFPFFVKNGEWISVFHGWIWVVNGDLRCGASQESLAKRKICSRNSWISDFFGSKISRTNSTYGIHFRFPFPLKP